MVPSSPSGPQGGGKSLRRPPRAGFLLWNPDLAGRRGFRGRGPVPADAQVRLPRPLSPRLRTPTSPTRRPSSGSPAPFRAGPRCLRCPRCRRSDSGPIVGYEGGGGVCRPGDATRRLRRRGALSSSQGLLLESGSGSAGSGRAWGGAGRGRARRGGTRRVGGGTKHRGAGPAALSGAEAAAAPGARGGAAAMD